jgi:hypothetical protein
MNMFAYRSCIATSLLVLAALFAAAPACSSSADTTASSGQGGGPTTGATIAATIVATGSGTGMPTSSTNSTGTGATSCDVFAVEACNDCLEEKCCQLIVICLDDATCSDCLDDGSAAACNSNVALDDLVSCMYASCGEQDGVFEGEPPNPCKIAPDAWTCDPNWYAEDYWGYAMPTCECNCGVRDPDCDEGAPTSDCPADAPLCHPHCGCMPEDAACQ